ncbi:hypothetical protein BDR26DRAFT_858724 [Obelidium mucronatum]|nr:hypothetical protein BDR26DRAFT_858724 [Obelidium mucronatum]
MKVSFAITLLSLAYSVAAQSSSSRSSAATSSSSSSTSASASPSSVSAAATTTTTAPPTANGGSSAAGAGTVSTTSSGASLSIIQPLTASIFQVGQQLQITWSLTGASDVNFNKANITFEINDGTNPNNVVTAPNGALTFAKQPIVGDLLAVTTVPNIPDGKAYTVKATFKDTTKFIFWYSPSFQIKGGSAVAPSSGGANPSGGVASSPAAKPVTTTTSGATRSNGISSTQLWLALIPALLLAF